MSAAANSKPRASFTSDVPLNRVPTLGLSAAEACQALGVSWAFWREHIEPDVKVVRAGRRKIVAVSALEDWLDRHGERIVEGL